jgi:hypothetical protein
MKNARHSKKAAPSAKGHQKFTPIKNKNQRNLRDSENATRANNRRRSNSQKAPMKRRDMTPAAQRDFILKALRNSSKHTYWFRGQGCSHPAARVMELIEEGYQIASNRITAVDSDGYAHRGVAIYTLIAEPDMRDLFSDLEVA